jgi:hypothetical protein
MMRRYKASVLVASMSIAALANIVPAHAAETIEHKTVERIDYICERGVVVPVTYIKTGDLPAYAVLDADGKMVALQWHDQLRKYVALDEQDSYRWAEKDGQAVLSYLEADHTAKEVILLSACRADDNEE